MSWEKLSNSSLFMAILLLIAVGIFALVAWMPLIRNKFPSRNYKFALIFITISQAIQALFILGAGLDLYEISYSMYFAAFGLPLCILGGVLALKGNSSDRRGRGCVLSAILTALMWLFLISVH
jgi:hypothetical protein